ncbi:site-specific DNA-methyltransferase [Mycoplasmopsis synoviae]|uniref:site-specific DNA-methyltransferase n=2 Tax=Mycoplasmopsis synoviae TaxID=2109 RepID=UPI001CE101E5|nr:site-specific DNA-methyltransferase [Mycoplasmopsis synoviae]UBX98663.1 site-specific DNA-methyltransferase [Mycoplasmopsis synoviae]
MKNLINNLINDYKNKINEIAKSNLNEDQKKLIFEVLNLYSQKENCTEEELHNLYNLLIQRIKIGFTFDAAPGTINDQISYLEKNEKLSFSNDFAKPKNQLIIGENFDALKNLMLINKESEFLANFDLIYIDPPYNTESAYNDGNTVANDKENVNSNKFIYRDKFSRNGWLNMIYERLKIAKNLLKEDAVIFVSIDDSEQAYLKVLMDEIFGEENFVANCPRLTTKHMRVTSESKLMKLHDYLLVYAKNIKNTKFQEIKWGLQVFNFKDEKGNFLIKEFQNSGAASSAENRPNLVYPIYYNHKNNVFELDNNSNNKDFIEIWPRQKDGLSRWLWKKETFLERRSELFFWKNKIWRKVYENDVLDKNKYKKHSTWLDQFQNNNGTKMLNSILNKNNFDFPKPVNLIKWILNLFENKNIKVLDFFAGSGTTAQAVMELNKEDGGNRSYTLVTNNENNIAQNITYERLYRINNGHGTKKEEFDWSKTNEKYKSNLDVFDVKYKSTNLNNSRNIDEIQRKVIKMLSDFGINISLNKLNFEKITNELRSLKKLDT